MKETSILANKKAEVFKPTHKKIILDCLSKSEGLTNQEIALKTGLLYHSVARRTPELESDLKIRDAGQRNGNTIYEIVHQLTIEDVQQDYSYKKMKKHAKSLLKYEHLLQPEMINQLNKLIKIVGD